MINSRLNIISLKGGDKLRDFLEKIDVYEVNKQVSPKYEIPALAKKTDKTLLFKNVNGSELPVIINLANTREKIAKSIGCGIQDIPNRLMEAIDSPKETRINGALSTEEPDLDELPILKHYPKDKGKYITSGVVVTKNEEGERNASIHRLLVNGKDELGIRIVKRHLYNYFKEAEKKDKALEVGIVIGLDPASLLGTCTRVPKGYDEFKLIGSLKEQETVLYKGDTVDLELPDGEIILEGKILPNKRKKEGPFVDVTGTYDVVRNEPIIKLSGMRIKGNAIYQGLLPAGDEHKHIMGLPYEPLIIKKVNEVCDAKNAVLTKGSSCYLHGIVQINKKSEKDGLKAIKKAMEAHQSMKHCIVIDEDINIYKREDLEYAISTRVKGDEDVYVFPNSQGSTLDPRGEADGTVTKTGVDATKILDEKNRFERAKIPGEDELDIENYFGD